MIKNTKQLIDELRLLKNGSENAERSLNEIVRTMETLLISHQRYETMRKLTPRGFKQLWDRNMLGEKTFDMLVDELVHMKK